MTVTQYIGSRYVPLFSEPLDWDSTKEYEALTIVYYAGNSYTSRQSVPKGIDITNTKYWALTGNYNAQIEAYRKEVRTLDGRVTVNADAISAEKNRAVAAEKVNADAISAEKNRAVAAEKVNADAISAITHYSGKRVFSYDEFQAVKNNMKTSYGYITRQDTSQNITPMEILLPYDVNRGGILNDTTGFNDFDNDIIYSFNRAGAWNWKNVTIKSVQNVWGLIYPVNRKNNIGDVKITIKPYGCVILSPDDYEIPQTQIYRPFHYDQKYLKIYQGQDASKVSYNGTKKEYDFGKIEYEFDGDELLDKVLHFWCNSLDTPDNAIVVYKIGVMCNKPGVLGFNLGMDCKVSGIQEIGGSRAKIIGKGETITYMCSSPEFARMNPNFDINYRVAPVYKREELNNGDTFTATCRYYMPLTMKIYDRSNPSYIYECICFNSVVTWTTEELPTRLGSVKALNNVVTLTSASYINVVSEVTELCVSHNEAILI